MTVVSAITVRVHLRPTLTMWDAFILRIAGREVRAAFVRVLDAAAEHIRTDKEPPIEQQRRFSEQKSVLSTSVSGGAA